MRRYRLFPVGLERQAIGKNARLVCASALAFGALLNLMAVAAHAAGPSISIVTSPSNGAGTASQHLSGDAVPTDTRYQIVISPSSANSLSVSSTANGNLFRTSNVSAGRPLRLPQGGGWYSAPAKSGEIKLVVTQDGASAEHVIRTIDARPIGVSGRDAAPTSLPESHSRVQAPVDFKALINDVSAFRNMAAQLDNIRQRTPTNAKGVDVYRRAAPSVVVVKRSDGGFGSGIVIRPGEVLTNVHVVKDAKSFGIILFRSSEPSQPSNTMYDAKLIKYDEVADLAVLSFSGPQVPSLQLGDEQSLAVGNPVHAIGHPLGQFWTYTQGIISQIRRNEKWGGGPGGKEHRGTVIQTQTPIAWGNSGGPLLDDDAKVVGVNTWIRLEREGYHYAVSVSEIKRFLALSGNRLFDPPANNRPAVAANQDAKPVSAPPQTCEPHALKSYLDKAINKKVTLVDTKCTGRPNFIQVGERAQRGPEYALIDAAGDSRIDIKILYDFKPNVNLWVFYGRRDGVPTAFGYEHDGSGRPDRIVAINMRR